eukprot:Nk52_evm8s314 gene=Nk52_evmTU8s314
MFVFPFTLFGDFIVNSNSNSSDFLNVEMMSNWLGVGREHNNIDKMGPYWGEPTSNVNWCEIDYNQTPYVAEFWNSMTSLAMAAMAFSGIITLGRQIDALNAFNYAMFLVVGLGSALFHGTLLYTAQMLDEVPMILASVSLLYSLLNLDLENWLNSHSPIINRRSLENTTDSQKKQHQESSKQNRDVDSENQTEGAKNSSLPSSSPNSPTISMFPGGGMMNPSGGILLRAGSRTAFSPISSHENSHGNASDNRSCSSGSFQEAEGKVGGQNAYDNLRQRIQRCMSQQQGLPESVEKKTVSKSGDETTQTLLGSINALFYRNDSGNEAQMNDSNDGYDISDSDLAEYERVDRDITTESPLLKRFKHIIPNKCTRDNDAFRKRMVQLVKVLLISYAGLSCMLMLSLSYSPLILPLTYTTVTIAIVVQSIRLLRTLFRHDETAHILFCVGLTFYAIGGTFWLLERPTCSYMEHLQLHSWWHLCAGFGAYMHCLFTTHCCAKMAGKASTLSFRLGVWPSLEIADHYLTSKAR